LSFSFRRELLDNMLTAQLEWTNVPCAVPKALVVEVFAVWTWRKGRPIAHQEQFAVWQEAFQEQVPAGSDVRFIDVAELCQKLRDVPVSNNLLPREPAKAVRSGQSAPGRLLGRDRHLFDGLSRDVLEYPSDHRSPLRDNAKDQRTNPAGASTGSEAHHTRYHCGPLTPKLSGPARRDGH